MQGSQYVGMLKSCLDIPAVEKMHCPKHIVLPRLICCCCCRCRSCCCRKRLLVGRTHGVPNLMQANSGCHSLRLEKAESILGWSVKKFCLEGPAVPWCITASLRDVARLGSRQEQIEQTKYCQPIMLLPQSKLQLLLPNSSCCQVRCRCCWDRTYEADVTGLVASFTSCSIADVLRCLRLRKREMVDRVQARMPCACGLAVPCSFGECPDSFGDSSSRAMPFPGRGWLESRGVHRALLAA